MKTRLLGVVLLVSAIIVGCEKAQDLLRFNIPVTSEFTIPKTSVLPPGFQTIPVQQEVNTSDDFAANGTSVDKVEEIKLNEADLEIINPENKSFGFLEAIEVHIAMEDGSDKIKIAFKDDIPENAGSKISLNTSDNELDQYLKAETFKLEFKYKLRETTDTEITIEIQQKYNVKAKI